MGKEGGHGVFAAIPADSREIVKSLKEIVNCSEQEIYAMLKECNMDPNDTVHRLLSQDTFREVKSKRERRKEVKETQEWRSRGTNSGLNNGVKYGSCECSSGCSGQTQSRDSELGKHAYNGENGLLASPLFCSSTSQTSEKILNQLPQLYVSHSDSVDATSKGQLIGTGDAIALSLQPSSGMQPAWWPAQGHVSMAEIVRMGGPQSKASNKPIVSTETSYLPYVTDGPNSSNLCVTRPQPDSLSQNPIPIASEIINEPGTNGGQPVYHEEWPVIEQSTVANGSSVFDASAHSGAEIHCYSSSLPNSRAFMSRCQPEEIQDSGNGPVKSPNTKHNGLTASSSKERSVGDVGLPSCFECDSGVDMSSHQSLGCTLNRQDDGGSKFCVPHSCAPSTDDLDMAVSSSATKFRQLSLVEENQKVFNARDDEGVVIPNHLQVSTADCLHLSFGTFKSGIGSEISLSLPSNPLKSEVEEVTSSAMDGSSASHLISGTTEYHGDEQLRFMSDAHRVNKDAGDYAPPVSSQPELMKHVPDAMQAHQDVFSSYMPDYTIENRQQLTTTLPYAQSSPHIRDVAAAIHAYSNSSPSNLSVSAVHSSRDSDFPYSTFLGTQSMSSKFSCVLPSMSSSSISISEQNLPSLTGTDIDLGPAFSQNRTMLSYPKSNLLPLRHAPDLNDYIFPPQRYEYLASATPQAYPGSTSHQSLAELESALLNYTPQQYRSSVSMKSLPNSAVDASGYRSFGGSANIAESFMPNQSVHPAGATFGYNDLRNFLYEDGNQYSSLQQDERFGSSVYGPGSRTSSSATNSTYYGLHGQNQLGRYRQGPKSMQHYRGQDYSNNLHPQIWSTHHQQQSPGDSTLNGYSRRIS